MIALSYTWGKENATLKARVLLGIRGEVATLDLRPNLVEALKHLRLATAPRSLWVDAICIHQTNIPERNLEVKRMGSIFKLARRVVAWLGTASSASTRGLDLLAALGERVHVTSDNAFLYTSATDEFCARESFTEDIKDMIQSQSLDQKLPYSLQDQEAIRDIFQRPWWDRLWSVTVDSMKTLAD